nr:WRKY transcription factor [Rehmannia glutinosa]
MANESFQEYKKLVNEIANGMEQVKQLRASSSSGNQERVLETMLTSYEEALLILNEIAPEGQDQSMMISSSDPPDRVLETILTSYEEAPFLNEIAPEGQDQSMISSSSDPPDSSVTHSLKKRRLLPMTTMLVRADSGVVPDDGYSWRKYGQKEILGSRYPRDYFRCAHLYHQKCLASKQVQRSDDDPNIFEVKYRGTHTCMRPAPVPPPLE